MFIVNFIKKILKMILPAPTNVFHREVEVIKNRIDSAKSAEHKDAKTILEVLENQNQMISQLSEWEEKYHNLLDKYNELLDRHTTLLYTKMDEIVGQNAYLSSEANNIKEMIDQVKEDIDNSIQNSQTDVTVSINESLNRESKKILAASSKNYSNIISTSNNVKQLDVLMHQQLDPELIPHAIKQWYQDRTGKVLDYNNLEGYNEKIQWIKAFERDERKTKLADKYYVRGWIKEQLGEDYLIPLLAVYNSAAEIDFDSLPNQFVLKANHGSHMIKIVRNKEGENLEELRRIANNWMHTNYAYKDGYEMHYNDIPRKLIVEEYCEDENGDLPDYKFWCFDGKVEAIEIIVDRKNGPKMAFFDANWNKLPYTTGSFPLIDYEYPMPEVMPEMIKVAEKLSSGFNHVRVDLYLLKDRIKFGEMTFTSSTGTCNWTPEEANIIVGNMLKLPIDKDKQNRN